MKSEIHRLVERIRQIPTQYEDFVERSEAIRNLLRGIGFEASVNLILLYLKGQLFRFAPAEATVMDTYMDGLRTALTTGLLPGVPSEVDKDYSGITAGMNNFTGALYDIRRSTQHKDSPEIWSEILEEALGSVVLGALCAYWEETHPGWLGLYKIHVDVKYDLGDLSGLTEDVDQEAVSEAGAFHLKPEAREYEHQHWLIVANEFESLLDAPSDSTS